MLRKIDITLFSVIALILVTVAASTVLTDSTLNRNAYYLAAFIAAVVFIFSPQRRVSREGMFITAGILLVGLSQFIWLMRFPSSGPLHTDSEYLTTALRLINGALLIFTLSALKHQFSNNSILFVKILVIVGTAYSSGVGLYFYYIKSSLPRLEINTVATMTAYIYTLQSLLTVYVISTLKFRYKSIALTATILITAGIILLTGTRAAILTYPLFLVLFFFRTHHVKVKTMLISGFSALLLVAIIFQFFSHTTQRVVNSVSELEQYQQGNGNTSLGSRISMWKAGINAFTLHPEGQSADGRLALNSAYIKQYEHGNPTAMANIGFHLHNDFIEATSLQGVAGGIALTFFFLCICYGFYLQRFFTPVIFLLLPTFIFGLTDTLFIDHRFVTCVGVLLVLYQCLHSSSSEAYE